MRISLLISAGLTALLLAGCSTPSASPNADATGEVSESQPSSTVQSPSLATPSQEPEVVGPVALYCDETQFSVVQLGINDATMTAISSFQLAGEPTMECLSGAATGQMKGPRYRQMFSSDFKRLAISWKDTTTNSSRVGFVDSATGERTDVTDRLASGSDFSAVPQHDNAMFAPDGSFFYRDKATKSFVWVDPESYQERRVSTPEDYRGEDWWVGADGVPESNYNLTSTGYAQSIAAEGENEILGLTNDIQTFTWLDGTRALAVGRAEGGGGAVGRGSLGTFNAHVRQADGQSPSGRFKAITPESDFTITSAVGDEKGEVVFFTAVRGQEGYLFLVPADGTSEPKRIGPVKGGGTLLDFVPQNSPSAESKPVPSAAPKVNRADFVGTWSGPVTGDSSAYDVVAVISDTNGTLSAVVKYPQLECEATWKELGADSDGMRLLETVSGRCAQGVKIRLFKSGNQVLVEFNGRRITSTMNAS